MLLDILKKDDSLRSHLIVLPEECSCHVAESEGNGEEGISYERARYLSVLYRANLASQARGILPIGTRCLPFAALLSLDPISNRPVLLHILDHHHAAYNWSPGSVNTAESQDVSVLAWYTAYCNIALNAALRLWICYGVTLELHPQNTLIILSSDGTLQRLVCREVAGGAYCYEPLLIANGFDLREQLHNRQDAIFDKMNLPLNILLHAVFCQHLLPLADAITSLIDAVSHDELLDQLRMAIRSTLDACGTEHNHSVLKATEHALLHSRTTRAKCLLHMRALGTKSEMFTEATNPLWSPDHQRQQSLEEKSDGRTLGRLAGFPLSWRPLKKVAGGSSWDLPLPMDKQPSSVAPPPAADAPLAVTFSSSGLLLTYHAGVAKALHASKLPRFKYYNGVSGGAVVALLLCTAPSSLQAAIDYMVSREWAHDLTLADIWDPAARLLPAFLSKEGVLPPDAFKVASGSLRVYVTRCDGRTSHVIDHWSSNEELIQTVQASCSFASSGVTLSDGIAYWDGGCARDVELLPTALGMETITVAPIGGVPGATIAPPSSESMWRLPTSYGDVSIANIVRAWDVSMPRSSKVMARYVADGERDARKWLAAST